jgi:hypothetical protein
MGLMGFFVFPPNPLMPPPPPSDAWPTNALIPFTLLASAPLPYRWFYVRRRFDQLLANLTITDSQRKDGQISQAGIRDCLNRHYWGYASETANSMLIGSWGKDTRNRPPRDIDVLFLLPGEVYWRFNKRSGNRQSQLLQEIRAVLTVTYPQTRMRGDGQVVVVPFNTIPIEISPGFRCTDGSIIICDTNNEGRYKTSTAEAEALDLAISDMAANGNTRALVRMMKQWLRVRNVPLKPFQLERLAVEFMAVWPYRLEDAFWYDWMVRDFLAYLLRRANGYLFMPGTSEQVMLGADWFSRAETAYHHAVSASKNEYDNYQALAGKDWQEIFGSAAPVLVL